MMVKDLGKVGIVGDTGGVYLVEWGFLLCALEGLEGLEREVEVLKEGLLYVANHSLLKSLQNQEAR